MSRTVGDLEMFAGVAQRWAGRVGAAVCGKLRRQFRADSGLAAAWRRCDGGHGFWLSIRRDGRGVLEYRLTLVPSESGLTLTKSVASPASGGEFHPAPFFPEQPGRVAHATTAGDVLFDLARTLDGLARVRRM